MLDQQHISGSGSPKCAFDFDSLSVQWENSTGDEIANTSTTETVTVSTSRSPSTRQAIDIVSISTSISLPQVLATTPRIERFSTKSSLTLSIAAEEFGSAGPEKTASLTLTAIVVLAGVAALMTILCVAVVIFRLYKKLPCCSLIKRSPVEFSHQRLDEICDTLSPHVASVPNTGNYQQHVHISAVNLQDITNEDIYSEINDQLYEEIQDIDGDCVQNILPQQSVPTTRNAIMQENTIHGVYVVNPECAANPEHTV